MELIEDYIDNKFDIGIKVKLKNGVLLRFIESKGWTQADFAREIGVRPCIAGLWFNLKDYPRKSHILFKICQLVKKTPEEIFPRFIKNKEFLQIKKDFIIYKKLDQNQIEYYSNTNDLNEIKRLSFESQNDYGKKINQIFWDYIKENRSSRDMVIIDLRYGLTGKQYSIDETSKIMHLTPSRIQQIQKDFEADTRQFARINNFQSYEDFFTYDTKINGGSEYIPPHINKTWEIDFDKFYIVLTHPEDGFPKKIYLNTFLKKNEIEKLLRMQSAEGVFKKFIKPNAKSINKKLKRLYNLKYISYAIIHLTNEFKKDSTPFMRKK